MNRQYLEVLKGLGRPLNQTSEVPAIPRALQAQDKALDTLHESITELEKRLQTVSRKEPTCAGQDKCPEASPQGVAGALEKNNRIVSSLTGLVQNMIRLLEV